MMDTKRPSLLDRVVFRAVRLMESVARRLSVSARLRLGRVLGSFAYLVNRRNARLARTNIHLALQVDSREATRIAKASYRHVGRIFTEVLALPEYATAERDDLFEVEGFEHFERAHRAGRGVIVFTAHIGNWEILGARQASTGYPIDAVAKALSNQPLDEWLTRLRESSGNRVLGYKNVLLRAIRRLKNGHTLFILPDQYARSSPRLFLPFLGRRTAVTPFLARLALKLDVPVIPACSIPRADGGYLIKYYEPIPHPTAGNPEERVLEFTTSVTRAIEDWVREHPEFWFWQHNRWKTTDRDEAEYAEQVRTLGSGASRP